MCGGAGVRAVKTQRRLHVRPVVRSYHIFGASDRPAITRWRVGVCSFMSQSIACLSSHARMASPGDVVTCHVAPTRRDTAIH